MQVTSTFSSNMEKQGAPLPSLGHSNEEDQTPAAAQLITRKYSNFTGETFPHTELDHSSSSKERSESPDETMLTFKGAQLETKGFSLTVIKGNFKKNSTLFNCWDESESEKWKVNVNRKSNQSGLMWNCIIEKLTNRKEGKYDFSFGTIWPACTSPLIDFRYGHH